MIRLLIALSFLAVAVVAPAQAQQVPSFKLPNVITPEEVEGLSVDFDEAFGTIPNPYLSDTIKLQYQMSLMEKLVERQSALEQISEAYGNMGVSYNAPPPPRGICAQLPANGPCLAAFPDLYPALVEDRKAHYDELKKKAAAAIAAANAANAQPVAENKKEGETDEAAIARQKKEAAERAAKLAAEKEERERKDRYRWTDVTCLAGQCRGVLTKGNGDYRVTVRPGERLPDGTVVQQISTSGIRVSIKGDVINVRPAPGEEAPETGGASQQGVLSVLPETNDSGPDGPSPAQAAASAAVADAMAASRAAGNAGGGTAGGPGGGPGGAAGQGAAPANIGGAGSGQAVGEAPIGPSGLF